MASVCIQEGRQVCFDKWKPRVQESPLDTIPANLKAWERTEPGSLKQVPCPCARRVTGLPIHLRPRRHSRDTHHIQDTPGFKAFILLSSLASGSPTLTQHPPPHPQHNREPFPPQLAFSCIVQAARLIHPAHLWVLMQLLVYLIIQSCPTLL